MNRSSGRMRAVAGALALLVVASCTGTSKHQVTGTTGTTGSPGTSTPGGPADAATVRTGADGKLSLLLSKGAPVDGTEAAPVALVSGTDLGADAIASIVARLPAWGDDGSQASSFNWPTQSLAVPRAGNTVATPFPAPAGGAPATPATGPLEVTRVQPDGDVAIAPYVTLTFNQPMVPLATVDQLDALAVPATIAPAVSGHWRWLGTQTLRFDADDAKVDRLPMATVFTVTVPAGTTSAVGGALAESKTFTFRTPPVTLQQVQPADGQSLMLEPVLVASFDQRIDRDELVKHIVVKAGDQTHAVRLATDAEVAADVAAGRGIATDGLGEGRWIAFRPVDPLPADADVTISLAAGTPSAEGPLATTAAQTTGRHTFPPLRVRRAGCDSGECPPASALMIELTNPLDTARFDPAAVTVTPTLPGMSVSAYGDVVMIQGATKARTTYQVSLPADLTDVYGQTLGDAHVERIAIGSASPVLEQFPSAVVTLDPMVGAPTLTIATVNHRSVRLRLFQVTATDWPDFERYLVNAQQPQSDTVPPFRVLVDRKITVADKPDERVETAVDLSDVLGTEKLGHVVALVESTTTYSQNDPDYWANRPALAWVQATKIGVDAISDGRDLRVWATELSSGAPVAGVAVATSDGTGSATTDAAGMARFPLSATSTNAVTVTRGGDTALLPHDAYGGSWARIEPADQARWYVVDDRHTYRPGETVSVKGFVRRVALATDAALHAVAGGRVHYVATDAQGIQLAEGDAPLSPLGGFDLTFAVAAGANQGPARVIFTTDAVPGGPTASAAHEFAVQEFRRPDFEVTARQEGTDPVVSSAPATLAVDARYYAGGPLGAAPVTWTVTTTSASYSPPGWPDWSFGTWTPWWYDTPAGYATDGVLPFGQPGAVGESKQYSGVTGADGTQYLKVDFAGTDGVLPDLPMSVTAAATVEDVNRQQLASRTTMLVHPADFYVGLRSKQTFVRPGDPIDVDAVVTSIDGKAVPGRAVRVVASRSTWVLKNGAWVDTPADAQTCERTSGTDPVACSFTTSIGGTYTITATVVDDHGATSRTELTRWVSGGTGRPDRSVAREPLTIVPARADYAPGDTVEMLVQAPFAAGHGLVTISHTGIDATQHFDVVDGTAVVRLPLTERDVPAVQLAFEVVGTAARTGDDGRPLAGAPDRPAFAVGSLSLKVSTASRALTVKAVPRDAAMAPGRSTAVDVTVTGPDGRPVAGAELALAVVDEAVLALGPYSWPDPLAVFYAAEPTVDDATYGRESIALASPLDLTSGGGVDRGFAGGASTTAAAASATTAAGGARSAAAAPAPADTVADSAAAGAAAKSGTGTNAAVDVRTNFDALAVFKPSVTTGADGRATVDVTLPDNLTRYRVMVVAVHGDDRFGATDATITARKPLMVRPTAPRFLNFGDAFQLPVVVQNQTDQAMTVDLALQTANLTVTGAPGRRVEVPADDRVEVRFAVSAAAAGTARFRVAAVSGSADDAVTVDVPVYTPVTTEAFATYGVVDAGAVAQPVVAPTGVIPQFGGIDVTTSSTALQGLTDALISVVHHPYDSTDARATRILAVLSLRDVLAAFTAADLPSRAELDASVAADVAGIAAAQNGDGAFGYWERDGRLEMSDPFVSVQAMHALATAKAAGVVVPDDTWTRGLQYLAGIEGSIPPGYGDDIRASITAYALYVRNLAGSRDPAAAARLWNGYADHLAVDGMAWLWPVVDDASIRGEIARRIANSAVDTAGAVTFTTSYRDDAYVILQSERRTDAVVLDALIDQQPASDLIPKVVNGLLGHRTGGAWDGIQENAFVLVALKHYFDAYESQTPSFVARVWLGDRYAGEQEYAGRSTDRQNVHVPTAELVTAGDTSVVVAKEGTGRLYYRIGMTYAPDTLQSAPLDRGFVVQRTYEGVDSAGDVTRDASGVWHIKAGANVRVRLTMVAESQRTHVALVDPLAAGLEIVNPDLATSPTVTGPSATAVPTVDGVARASVWYPTWFDHQNLKDDRAEAFANLLPAGTYDYTYVARATTPGTFVVPPTRAEEIYEPETFGRAASAKVVIDA